MVNSTYINVSSDQPATGRRDTSAPGSSSSGEGTATSASNSSFVHVPHPHRAKQPSVTAPASGPASSSKSPVRHADGRASFLNAGDLDADDVDDDGRWAEEGTWWTAVASENVDEVKEGIAAIEKLVKNGKLNAGEQAVRICYQTRLLLLLGILTSRSERKINPRLPLLLDRRPYTSTTYGRESGGDPGYQIWLGTRQHRGFGPYTYQMCAG